MHIEQGRMPVSHRTDWKSADSAARTLFNTCSHVPFGTYYEDADHSGLKDMPGYHVAKKGVDRRGNPVSQKEQIHAARMIVESLLFDGGDRPTAFYNTLEERIGPDTLIVAPSLLQRDAKNVLPITFAHVLAKEFGAKVHEEVFQRPRARKKRDMDGAERLTHDTEFYGAVIPGRDYFLVDDVMTMGGTMAALRGYIESQGGHVIGVAVLADGTSALDKTRRADKKTGIPFAPAQEDLAKLEQRFSGGVKRLNALFKGYAGYDAEKLTAREINYVAGRFGSQGSPEQRTVTLRRALNGA